MKAFRFDKCGLERWYFVCNRCDAKWFSLQQRATCPRCRAIATSTDASFHRGYSRNQPHRIRTLGRVFHNETQLDHFSFRPGSVAGRLHFPPFCERT